MKIPSEWHLPVAPLKNKKPCKSLTYKAFLYWWLFTDSNRGPVDYDSIALTD